MKERGILFNDDMVRGIDAGRKTVTRRTQGFDWMNLGMPDIYKLVGYTEDKGRFGVTVSHGDDHEHTNFVRSPFGKVGDRVYVREAHFINDYRGVDVPEKERAECEIVYRANGLPDWEGEESEIRWTPSIHQPRWASRITLDITAVRVERLKDITEEQAIAEGCFFTDYGKQCFHGGTGWKDVGDCPADAGHPQREGWMWKETTSNEQCLHSARMAFANLWNTTGGHWDSNPWVWVYEFKKVTAP